MPKIFSKSGETLLEVLIALTVVTVAAAAAGSAIMSAVQGLSLSRNYLVAQNLADEGIEAVKNIRDTNWMKFPINKSTCWLVIAEVSNGSECETAESFSYLEGGEASNDYWLSPANGKWTATRQENDIDSQNIAKYSLGLSPDFYRAIRVSAQTNNGENGMTDSITIDSIVKWYEGSKLYSITGREILTNYLE